MNKQKQESEILLKANSQGFNIAIHGMRSAEGHWQCAVERNEIIFHNFPNDEHIDKLETERHYDMSNFNLTFDEAFKDFDTSEWFLCHPVKLHQDFAEKVLKRFHQQMETYEMEFPADSPMEKFIRKKKIEEWTAIATNS